MGVPILDAVLSIGTAVIERLWPDPIDQAKAKLELLKLQQQGEFKVIDADLQSALAQVNVNAEEAKSENIFKSGWRPAIGWICGSAFAYNFVVGPVLSFLGYGTFTPLDMSEMLPILLGMLGLGSMRTWEKSKGV